MSNAKKRIGQLYGKPIVIGDKNITTKNEIHIEELKVSNDSGNFGGLIWYDLSAMIKDEPHSNNTINLLDALPVTLGYLAVSSTPGIGNVFVPPSRFDSGVSPYDQTYIGLPSTIFNIDTGKYIDFFVFFDINKEELKKYIINISDILIENVIGTLMS